MADLDDIFLNFRKTHRYNVWRHGRHAVSRTVEKIVFDWLDTPDGIQPTILDLASRLPAPRDPYPNDRLHQAIMVLGGILEHSDRHSRFERGLTVLADIASLPAENAQGIGLSYVLDATNALLTVVHSQNLSSWRGVNHDPETLYPPIGRVLTCRHTTHPAQLLVLKALPSLPLKAGLAETCLTYLKSHPQGLPTAHEITALECIQKRYVGRYYSDEKHCYRLLKHFVKNDGWLLSREAYGKTLHLLYWLATEPSERRYVFSLCQDAIQTTPRPENIPVCKAAIKVLAAFSNDPAYFGQALDLMPSITLWTQYSKDKILLETANDFVRSVTDPDNFLGDSKLAKTRQTCASAFTAAAQDARLPSSWCERFNAAVAFIKSYEFLIHKPRRRSKSASLENG